MDPEQIYGEVLSEEQGKGSSPAVAEARAKAARKRAEEGSPHPKEPKWWPGSQPHFEGGGDAGGAEEAPEEAAPEPAEEAPAAAPAPAAESAPAGERSAAEAATQPAATTDEQREVTQGAAPVAVTESSTGAAAAETVAPAAASAAPAAPARPTDLPPEQRPTGVTHGTTTGTRLRPEDAVATDVQFEAQQAMYDRRKLIDDLVATGVPAVTANDTGRSRAPLLALLYLLIPILAIMFLVGQDAATTEPTAAEGEQQEEGGADNPEPGGPIQVVAEGSAFDTTQIELPADTETQIELVNNDDGVPHNISIYESEGGPEIFVGDETTGGPITYDIPPIPAGDYYFVCDFHPPSMNGDVTVK